MIEQQKGKKLYKTIDFLHKHIVGVIIIVVIIACCLSMIYYFSSDRKQVEGNENNLEYEDINTLYFPMSKINTLNPLTSRDRDVFYINQLLYSSLFRLDKNLNIEGDLVNKYSTNSKEGSVALTIKSGVKFSDGNTLTTSDVNSTISYIKEIGSKSPYYNYVSKIDSVQIQSDTKINIYFSNKNDAALDNLVFPIISGSTYSTDDSYKPVGSGQYYCSVYDRTKTLKLKANKDYYGYVANNKIQFKILPKLSAQTGLMTMDAITACLNTASDADTDAEDKHLNHTDIISNEVEYLGFNFKNKILSNKQIRQAIATAINTDNLVKDNYGGTAISSDSIYFPGFLGVENKGDAYPLNQSNASKLLRDAGYSDKDEDGILEDDAGKMLQLTLLVNKNDINRADAARDIAKNLDNIGISVKVKELGWTNYKSALVSSEFDLVLGGYQFDKQYNLKSLFGKKNYLNYKNDEVLAAVYKMENAISDSKEKETYEQLKQMLIDDLPYYTLCYKTYSFVTVNKFEGDDSSTFFDPYRGAANWSWQKVISEDTASDTNDESSN